MDYYPDDHLEALYEDRFYLEDEPGYDDYYGDDYSDEEEEYPQQEWDNGDF